MIVSSSPQVRYPDYYGIDIPRMNEFIAFVLQSRCYRSGKLEHIILAAYQKAKKQEIEPGEKIVNYVKEIYASFTDEEISAKMVELLTPREQRQKWKLSIRRWRGLHASCPNHPGDCIFRRLSHSRRCPSGE